MNFGQVFEAFGPITYPMYTIRFPSSTDIDLETVRLDRTVYYLPKRSSFLKTKALRAMKGSDASNVYDEEVDEDQADFSDDEAERQHKRVLEER